MHVENRSLRVFQDLKSNLVFPHGLIFCLVDNHEAEQHCVTEINRYTASKLTEFLVTETQMHTWDLAWHFCLITALKDILILVKFTVSDPNLTNGQTLALYVGIEMRLFIFFCQESCLDLSWSEISMMAWLVKIVFYELSWLFELGGVQKFLVLFTQVEFL